MSILLGVGVVTTITVFYLGKKGWQALHKAVGISPGVLVYQDPKAPLLLNDMSWQQLKLDKTHLKVLPDRQLRQLQDIDKKVVICHNYEQDLKQRNRTLATSEQQVVLQKLLFTRLPEMLASHYHLVSASPNASFNTAHNAKRAEAGQLLQEALDNIEQRLDIVLTKMESQHLQDLRVMKRYMDSHN